MQEPQETQDQSLGWDDPLEKEMATLSSILAWRIPWTEESGGLQTIGTERVSRNWAHAHTYTLIKINMNTQKYMFILA